jgi:hypothetical protein
MKTCPLKSPSSEVNSPISLLSPAAWKRLVTVSPMCGKICEMRHPSSVAGVHERDGGLGLEVQPRSRDSASEVGCSYGPVPSTCAAHLPLVMNSTSPMRPLH